MIGVVVGMQSEARLLPGYRVVCSGGNPDQARALAEQLLAEGARGLVSFGIAGGLDPRLKPGDLLIGSGVETDSAILPADQAWQQRLQQGLPDAVTGLVHGSSVIAATPEQKRRLHAGAQALAVDLESAAVALACAKAGRPFAVLRTIADPADRAIPALALSALGPDGRPLIGNVIKGLLRRPGDLPGLIAVGLDTGKALRSLDGAVRRLGPALGFEPD